MLRTAQQQSLTLGFAAVLEERSDGKTVRQQPLVYAQHGHELMG